jgi:type VI secretion system secreted protein Hcp
MASPAYMTIQDDKGNIIKANVMISGREGSAEVHAFDYAVSIPADPNSGLLTAVRKHDDVVVTKNFDQSSPLLFQACAKGSTLKSVLIDWYRINKDGEEEKYFSHHLIDVKVVKVQHAMLQVKDPSNEQLGHLENVSFRFRRIELTYPDGNIATQDDWLAARQ